MTDVRLERIDDLLERLNRGVVATGLHDDNNTELFDVEGANDAMHEAAQAIEALRTPVPAGEPVAWQHRGKSHGTSQWTEWRDGRNQSFDRADGDEFEERPLYAAPPASSPSVGVTVKPLEWIDQSVTRPDITTKRFMAQGPFSVFHVHEREDGEWDLFLGYFGAAADGRQRRYPSLDAAQSAAQEVHDELIRSALLLDGGEAEPDTIKVLRHECAKSGPCAQNGDGCACSVGELVNRHNFIVGASSPPTAKAAPEGWKPLTGGEIHEWLFTTLKGDVPEPLTNEVLDGLAGHIKEHF